MVKLSKDQIQFYKDNGYIILKNILSKKKTETISKEYDTIFNSKQTTDTAWEGDAIVQAAGNKAYSVDSVHDLQFHSEVFSDLVLNKNLMEAIEDLMGTPNIYPGSHKNGPMEDYGYKGSEVQSYHWVDPKKYSIEGATPVSMDAGDFLVFSYLTLHGSYMNLSENPRRMFLMQLCDADDEPTKEAHKSEGQGWVLRGMNNKRPAQATR